jgi:hypothetical protein
MAGHRISALRQTYKVTQRAEGNAACASGVGSQSGHGQTGCGEEYSILSFHFFFFIVAPGKTLFMRNCPPGFSLAILPDQFQFYGHSTATG